MLCMMKWKMFTLLFTAIFFVAHFNLFMIFGAFYELSFDGRHSNIKTLKSIISKFAKPYYGTFHVVPSYAPFAIFSGKAYFQYWSITFQKSAGNLFENVWLNLKSQRLFWFQRPFLGMKALTSEWIFNSYRPNRGENFK